MTLLWFDTEFIEDGRTIDLLSIGIVRADGATLYLESSDADRSRAKPWVRANVLLHLTGPTVPRIELAARVREFAGPEPEWWAYFAVYDWVALCQLYGAMMNLPDGWPMYCRDVQQTADGRGIDLEEAVPAPDVPHHALSDAQWTRRAWDYLAAVYASECAQRQGKAPDQPEAVERETPPAVSRSTRKSR